MVLLPCITVLLSYAVTQQLAYCLYCIPQMLLSYAVKNSWSCVHCMYSVTVLCSKITTSTAPLHYCVDVLCSNTTSGTAPLHYGVLRAQRCSASPAASSAQGQNEPPPHARLDLPGAEEALGGPPRGVRGPLTSPPPPRGVPWALRRPATADSPAQQPSDAQGQSEPPSHARLDAPWRVATAVECRKVSIL